VLGLVVSRTAVGSLGRVRGRLVLLDLGEVQGDPLDLDGEAGRIVVVGPRCRGSCRYARVMVPEWMTILPGVSL